MEDQLIGGGCPNIVAAADETESYVSDSLVPCLEMCQEKQ